MFRRFESKSVGSEYARALVALTLGGMATLGVVAEIAGAADAQDQYVTSMRACGWDPHFYQVNCDEILPEYRRMLRYGYAAVVTTPVGGIFLSVSRKKFQNSNNLRMLNAEFRQEFDPVTEYN